MSVDFQDVSNLSREARKADYLDAETEEALARAWRDNGDEKALHTLVKAYMRLAISMARKYRRHGLNQHELVQEASLGLLKAAEKFDPDRGVRFSTYSVWWIKASIQEYVMRNWSLVRTGSTATQKSLFFNLRRVRAEIEREAMNSNEVLNRQSLYEEIASQLRVPVRDVQMMDGRMSGGDLSLNAVQGNGEDDSREWIETIEDGGPLTEDFVSDTIDGSKMRAVLGRAMDELNERERKIVAERKLVDDPRTLESLGSELGISKERVRQLESAALEKLRKFLVRSPVAGPQEMLPTA